MLFILMRCNVSNSKILMWKSFFFLSKQFDKTWMAVRFVVLFLEGTFVELLETERTHKVLRVKFTMHGSDATACDWLLTAVAQCASAGVIVHLTVRSAFMLKEASSWKSLMAFLKRNDQILISLYNSNTMSHRETLRRKIIVNQRTQCLSLCKWL